MNAVPQDYQHLLYSKDSRVATITLNRPDEANGLNTQLAAELANVALECAADDDVKAVILTGSGRFFCAGGDVKAMSEFGDRVEIGLKKIADDLHRAISTFARMDAPLIVAVNGTAAGAGFSMAISGDLVYAADSAKFTMAYSNIGLSPDGSSSYYLPRLVGLRKAQELMLTNRVLSAEEAQQWGLINKVIAADQVLVEAQTTAKQFVSGSKGSTGAIKRLLCQTFDNGLETQMEIEGRTIANISTTRDGREGVSSFIEKRKAEFD